MAPVSPNSGSFFPVVLLIPINPRPVWTESVFGKEGI